MGVGFVDIKFDEVRESVKLLTLSATTVGDAAAAAENCGFGADAAGRAFVAEGHAMNAGFARLGAVIGSWQAATTAAAAAIDATASAYRRQDDEIAATFQNLLT